MTTIPIAGIASRFASTPYWVMVLKWKAEIGAVAAPATSDVMAIATTGLAKRQLGAVCVTCHQARPRNPSNAAMSATVAAKDIWNPGCIRLSGVSSKTISPASATARSVSAGRSSTMATSTVAVIT